MRRKGLGRGTGKGYKNIIGKDSSIHSQSARGIKQPQIPSNVMDFIERNPAMIKKALKKETKLEDIEFNDDAIDNFIYDDYMVRIFQDDTPDDPRTWDNMGKMVAFHNRYNLGDESEINQDSFKSWDEMEKYLIKEKKAVIISPLYLYDHSGLRIKIGSFGGSLPQGHAEFDSGQVGFIYATEKEIKENYQVKKVDKKILEKARKNLIGEVETYGQYLSGDTYGYKIYDKTGSEVDSLWGMYGSDYVKEESKGMIDSLKKQKK